MGLRTLMELHRMCSVHLNGRTVVLHSYFLKPVRMKRCTFELVELAFSLGAYCDGSRPMHTAFNVHSRMVGRGQCNRKHFMYVIDPILGRCMCLCTTYDMWLSIIYTRTSGRPAQKVGYSIFYVIHVGCRHNVCHLVVAFTICFFFLFSLFSFNHMPQVNIGYKIWTKWCSRWTNNLVKLPKLAVWLVIRICCLSSTVMKFGRYSKRRKRYRTGAVQIIYDRIARV